MANVEKFPSTFEPRQSGSKGLALGLIITSSMAICISLLFGVSLTSFASIGYLPFALAAAASLAGLAVRAVRFRMIADTLAGGEGTNLAGSISAKVASEFVALVTPSASGGLVLSTAWLSRRGVTSGKALGVGYFESLIQTYVGCILSLFAAAYAISKGALLIGGAITLVAMSLVICYTAILLIPNMKELRLPKKIFWFVEHLFGARQASRLAGAVEQGCKNFSVTAHTAMSRTYFPLIAKATALTVADALLSGLSLWFIVTSAGLKIDIGSAVMMASGVIALGTLPISIAGSGIAELAMRSYLSSVYGFTSSAAVVLWRTASYQVLLGVSGIAFLVLLRSAARRTSARDDDNPEILRNYYAD